MNTQTHPQTQGTIRKYVTNFLYISPSPEANDIVLCHENITPDSQTEVGEEVRASDDTRSTQESRDPEKSSENTTSSHSEKISFTSGEEISQFDSRISSDSGSGGGGEKMNPLDTSNECEVCLVGTTTIVGIPERNRIEPKETKIEPKVETEVEPNVVSKETKVEPNDTNMVPKETKVEPSDTNVVPKETKVESTSGADGSGPHSSGGEVSRDDREVEGSASGGFSLFRQRSLAFSGSRPEVGHGSGSRSLTQCERMASSQSLSAEFAKQVSDFDKPVVTTVSAPNTPVPFDECHTFTNLSEGGRTIREGEGGREECWSERLSPMSNHSCNGTDSTPSPLKTVSEDGGT